MPGPAVSPPRAAGLERVPCRVQQLDPKQTLVAQLTENWQRLDLDPLDVARTLERLREDHGLTQAEIGALIGKARSEVSKVLSLIKLTPEVQEAARGDQSLSRRHLTALATLPPEEQEEALSEVRERHLNSTETESMIAGRIGRTSKSKGPSRSQHRFSCSQGTVLLTFRKRRVSPGEVRGILEEAMAQYEECKRASARARPRLPEPGRLVAVVPHFHPLLNIIAIIGRTLERSSGRPLPELYETAVLLICESRSRPFF